MYEVLLSITSFMGKNSPLGGKHSGSQIKSKYQLLHLEISSEEKKIKYLSEDGEWSTVNLAKRGAKGKTNSLRLVLLHRMDLDLIKT